MQSDSTPPTSQPNEDHPLGAEAVPKRVWKSTALQVFGRIFGAGATFATLAILARHLSGPEFGRYTFYIAVFMLLDALADFGTGATAVQYTATRPDRLAATLKTARRIRLSAASVGLLVLILGTWISEESSSIWIWAAALYPLTYALELSTVPFKNRIDWRMPVKARLFASTFRLSLIIGLWQLDVSNAGVFIFATALGSSTANFLIHFAARRELRSLPHRNAPAIAWAPFLRLAAPLGFAGLAQQAYFYVDNLFIRPLAGEVELGHYNAGVRLMSFGIMVAQYASLAALPWLARRHKDGALDSAVARLGQPLFFGAALVSGLVIPHSGKLLGIIFGEPFQSAGASMAWLFGAMAVIYFGSLHLTAVVASGRTGAVSRITLIALVANMCGNAWLVPRYGIEGAAIATVITEAIVAILAAISLAKIGIFTLRHDPLRWLAGPVGFALTWAFSASL